MNPNYCLIIVDIQTFFLSTFCDTQIDALIKNISDEIIKAKRNFQSIIFVEYNPTHYGPTYATLRQLVKNYPNTITIEKEFISGSSEIMDYLKYDYRFNKITHLKVCGIYLEQCVKATVNGLAEEELFRIDLLMYASQFGKMKDSFSDGDINPNINIIEKVD